MAKIGCGEYKTYTHEEHDCIECVYEPNKETEYPCNVCKNGKCYWMPKL